MKRYLKAFIIITFICICALLIKKYYFQEYKLKITGNDISWTLKFKGIKGGKDFTQDSEGNYYVAYKDKIQLIYKNGKSVNLINDSNLDISSIDYYNGSLYFTSGCKVICYNLDSKKSSQIIGNIPNLGDYKESLIKIYGNYAYISIGSVTNSGVVGKDNSWINESEYYCDISPKDIILKGQNFGSEATGAFVPYKTKNYNGQIISAHLPGNASVIIINLKSGNCQNFAWGIRNIKGMDFDSEGNLFASVGGMEDRGLRPIKGDSDYIYQIKKDAWYGWPDFSGGDPVTSPKFKSDSSQKNGFIMDKHPTENPPAPVYQHKDLSALGSVTIDRYGSMGEKNCVYFYDSKLNEIFALDKAGKVYTKMAFGNDSSIESMKFAKDGMLLLDSKNGCIYLIHKILNENTSNIYNNVFYCLIGIIMIGILFIIKNFK